MHVGIELHVFICLVVAKDTSVGSVLVEDNFKHATWFSMLLAEQNWLVTGTYTTLCLVMPLRPCLHVTEVGPVPLFVLLT